MSAARAFGDLVVDGDTIALCISSGNPPNERPEFYARLANTPKLPQHEASTDSSVLVPDQIVIWDHRQERLHTVHDVHILQYKSYPMLVRIIFQCPKQNFSFYLARGEFWIHHAG